MPLTALRRAGPALAVLLALGHTAARHACAQDGQPQSFEARIAVPGLGQQVASGLYSFKFAVVDAESGETLWSHDGSSVRGSEPQTSIPLFVDRGYISVQLGEPPIPGLPLLTSTVIEKPTAVLRVWVSNTTRSDYLRLRDQRVGGRGFAYTAEQARNAERLQGRQAIDFEPSGAVASHEQRMSHTPWGHIPGGRFYNGQVDLGGGRETSVHFDVPTIPVGSIRTILSLHGGARSGPPSLSDLRLHVERTEGLAVGATRELVQVRGDGWLGGIHESYDFCNTCFKRKLPPRTDIVLDGVPFDAWLAARQEPSPGDKVGRVASILPLGLVRFERSLEVTLNHQGADEATGSTVVWYFTDDALRGGGPGGIQILLDGADVTPALASLPEAAPSLRAVAHKLLASRYDGPPQVPDSLRPEDFLARPADRAWLLDGAEIRSRVGEDGSTFLLQGEIYLDAGGRTLKLEGSAAAALDLYVDGRFRRAVALTEAGMADATLSLAAASWYPLRLLVAAQPPRGDLRLTVDGHPPTVRTAPLLGGSGGESWSAGPLELGAAGITMVPGPHVLTLRERSGRGGQLEYGLLVE